MEIVFAPAFIRQLKKLEPALQEEVLETIELLKNPDNFSRLKVHKLKGQLKDNYSCSVNYAYRIVFAPLGKREIALLTVGNHKIYQ